MIICPNCGKQLDDGKKFCSTCGAKLFAEEAAPAEKEYQAPVAGKKKSKFPKKLIGIGSAVVAVALAVVIVFTMFMGSNSNPNYLLYIKDNELYYSDIDNIEPWQVTEKLSENEDYLPSLTATLFQMSSDGKTIFFLDKLDNFEEEGGNLYYRTVNDSEAEATKVDSDVASYLISKDGSSLYYLKRDGRFYYSDLEEKEKIDEDVYSFMGFPDGDAVMYTIVKETSNGNVYNRYYKKQGEAKEKLFVDAEDVKLTEDFSAIYYREEDNVYKKEFGKDKEKLLSDVEDVIVIHDSGEIYYTKKNEEISYIDFFEDDLASSDAALTKPIAPVSPDRYSYDSVSDYIDDLQAYYDEYDVYNEKNSKWEAKLERDEFRKKLKSAKVGTVESLYFYDGKETTEIAKCYYVCRAFSRDVTAMVYSAFDPANIPKVKMSEFDEYYIESLESAVEESFGENVQNYVANEATAILLEDLEEDAGSFKLAPDGKTIYYYANWEVVEEGEDEGYYFYPENGDIYKITLSDGKAGKSELYISDAYRYGFSVYENGMIVHLQNYDEEKNACDLYINNKLVGEDVYRYESQYDIDTEKYYYIADYDKDDYSGTLMVYENGKSTVVAEDVWDFFITPGAEIAYLCDFSIKNNEGTLYIYNGSESKMVDDDVAKMFYVYTYDELIKGYFYSFYQG